MNRAMCLPASLALVFGAAPHSTALGDALPVIPYTKVVAIPFLGIETIAGDSSGIVASASTGDQVVIVDGDPESGPWQVTSLAAANPFSLWGHGLARSAELVVVGAPTFSVAGFPNGRVTTFTRVGGAWTAEGDFAGPTQSELLGWALALDGATLVVGCPGAAIEGLASAGMVRIYERTSGGWTLVQTVTSDAPRANEFFGSAVSLRGDVLAIGGMGSDRAGPASAGAAWLFQRTAAAPFSLTTVLTSPNPQPGDLLGSAVDGRDGIFAAGAPNADAGSVDSGAALVAVREPDGTWTPTIAAAPSGLSSAGLGVAVLVGTDRVVASAALTGNVTTVGFRRIAGIWQVEYSSPLIGPICQYGPRIAGAAIGSPPRIGIVPVDLDCNAEFDASDCNRNFIADSCDIANGDAPDVDGDGLIDGCPDSWAPIAMPDAPGSQSFTLYSYLALGGGHAVTVPVYLGSSGTPLESQWPTYVDFTGSDPATTGESVPAWCGYASPVLTPLTAQSEWLAVGGVEAGQLGRVSVFDIPATGSLVPNAVFSATQPSSFFGSALASTSTTIYAAVPLDPDGLFPIRRFERSRAGAWSELSPITLASPAPATGVALAVRDSTLAVSDQSPADATWAKGRVRIFSLNPDGSTQEEASLRVAPSSVSTSGLFGARVEFAADRLFVFGMSSSNSFNRVWIYRDTPVSGWTLEAELVVTPTVPSASIRSVSVRDAQFVLGTDGKGIETYRRAANGAWLHDGVVTSVVQSWTIGYGIALADAGKLVTTAKKTVGFQAIGELWLLDPVTDCNGNGADDSDEIAAGLPDADHNGVPDECELRGDMDLNGVVNAVDLGILLGRYGQGPGLGDLDDDGDVDSADLAILLGEWS